MSKRVLLIADACRDVFIHVDASRLSPEIPVPVVIPYSVRENPGMGGNVLANLNSLAPDLEVSIIFPPDMSVKTRYVDRKTNHHFIRVDQDAESAPLAPVEVARRIDETYYDAVVISDYAKGFLDSENMREIAMACERHSIPVFADTKQILGHWSKAITFVKINSIEFNAHTAIGETPWRYCKNLIVTNGKEGMDLMDAAGAVAYRSPIVPATVADTVGCGDTALAALVVSYLETGDIRTAMDFANRVGAVAVSKRGVVAVRREEVR